MVAPTPALAPGSSSDNCENSWISEEQMLLDCKKVTCKDLVWFLLHKDTKKWKFPRTNSGYWMIIVISIFIQKLLQLVSIPLFWAGSKIEKLDDNNKHSSSKMDIKDEYGCFEYRMIIVISIFIQKLLQLVSIPLFRAGSKIERWFNICSHNGNHFGVFLNLLQRKMLVPDTNSDTYLSFIGCLDKRMTLHTHIKHGDPKFHSSLAVMASKLSYENKSYIKKTVTQVWKMEFIDSFDFWNDYQRKYSTQAFIFKNKNVDPELIVIAFRGTETFVADDWCTDLDLSWFNMGKKMGKVHIGFMKALGLKKVENHLKIVEGLPKNLPDQESNNDPKLAYYEIRKILNENKNGRFIITGHSLGGALAALFPAILAHHEEDALLDRMEGVYTFGQPRVGDKKFGKFMSDVFRKHEIRYYRFVYGMDIVPRLPYYHTTLTFKHFGSCILFEDSYIGEKVENEPNNSYFSIRWAPRKFMIACKELKRSFYNPHHIDEEGWTMRFIRMLGLIFPGFSAHSLCDYDNSIRLSPDDAFLDVANSVS